MVKKVEKGRRSMRKARAFAESLGFIVFQIHHTRYQKDIFHLWDQIWIGEGYAVWVQVKTNRYPSKKEIKKYLDWCEKYKQIGTIFLVRDRKPSKLLLLSSFGVLEVLLKGEGKGKIIPKEESKFKEWYVEEWDILFFLFNKSKSEIDYAK